MCAFENRPRGFLGPPVPALLAAFEVYRTKFWIWKSDSVETIMICVRNWYCKPEVEGTLANQRKTPKWGQTKFLSKLPVQPTSAFLKAKDSLCRQFNQSSERAGEHCFWPFGKIPSTQAVAAQVALDLPSAHMISAYDCQKYWNTWKHVRCRGNRYNSGLDWWHSGFTIRNWGLQQQPEAYLGGICVILGCWWSFYDWDSGNPDFFEIHNQERVKNC